MMATADVRVPAYERVQLPNGAVLLLMERHDVPLISFEALLRGGSVTDAPDKAGTASLLAAVLEKGAGSRNALAFAETVANVGGSLQTGADTEGLVVSGSFLARDRALMVELLADVLQRPKLEAEQVTALRDRYIEFIHSAKDSDLGSLTSIYAASFLFGAHPYARPTMGSEATLATLEHADVVRAYEQQVGADRLILAVVGDFKIAQMKQTLSRAFSGWRKAGVKLSSLPVPTKITGRRVLLIDAPDSVQSYFWAGNVGVARGDPRRAPLDVANTLFGGRFTSMLNGELRIRTGLSYGASSHFDRMTQPGPWEMTSFTRTETTEQAIDLALSVLDKFHSADLDPTLLASGKAYVQGQFPLAFETAGHWSVQLVNLEQYGLDRNYIEGYATAINAVTPQSAKAAISDVIPSSQDVLLVVIGKADVLRESLKKYGPLSEMKLADPTFAAPGGK
jgi:predicted Zn-dependent peptidase